MTHSIAIKVVPGAATDELCGWLDDALKLRVRAAPKNGMVNEVVIALFARAPELPASRIVIGCGATGSRKTVAIDGLHAAELQRRITARRPS